MKVVFHMKHSKLSSTLHVLVPGEAHMQKRRQRHFWLLVTPALLLFSAFLVAPLINMFYISTLDWRGLVKPSTFAGVSNYIKLFQDDQFYIALRNTCIHLLITLGVVLPTSFMLGFFLSRRPAGYRWLRTIFFIPGMLSAPALAMIFIGMYMPDGIINLILRNIGFENLTRVWLADKNTSLGAVIAVDIWGGIGWYSVMFFAALSNVSKELYEAAQIDGANYWKMMWGIAFPISLDFFGVMTLLLYLWILMGSAQNVLLLTNGGPGNSSLTLGFYLYRQAFEIRNLGYSQTIGVFIFTIGLLGTMIIRRFSRTSISG